MALREDVALIVGAGQDAALLDELLFRAKFVSRAREVLGRVGADSTDAANLAVEFRSSIEQITAMLTTLGTRMADDIRTRWQEHYLALSPESLGNLLTLCRDLTLLKNYSLDTRGTESGK